ncbi:MAG TPA: cupin domain-containing protein [Stellaceae bacterium]|nr:cupin domain-containing protein [Stellaceae bacterium]
MDQTTFESELRRDGYADIVDRRMEANQFNPDHAHEFDARVLVLEGEMTITHSGTAHTYRAGDMCALAAGTVHSERCGPAGARYLAGRRDKSGS